MTFAHTDALWLILLAPLAVLCIALGVLPKQTLFNFMNGTLDLMLHQINTQVAGPAVAAAQSVIGM